MYSIIINTGRRKIVCATFDNPKDAELIKNDFNSRTKSNNYFVSPNKN